MNKRGSAFGAFNGIYGVAWFAGSVLMGVLYDHSILALVIFGVALQALAAIFFLSLDGRVRQAAGAR
jgi:predicted MFS family arabinose efflux permease